jgi:hypothetical protein
MGTYSGSDSGNFGVMVDASTGDVAGVAYSTPYSQYMTLSGTSPLSYDQLAAFVSGTVSAGASFSGNFTSVNGVSGTWSGGPGSGSFSGARIGGASTALYRFTGRFSGSDYGLFSFDIDGANNATGVGYSVTNGQLFTLSGHLSGTSISATSSTGGTITGTLNTSTGSLSGSWSSSGSSGTYSGSGCKLN